jgi:hypothetical protein
MYTSTDLTYTTSNASTLPVYSSYDYASTDSGTTTGTITYSNDGTYVTYTNDTTDNTNSGTYTTAGEFQTLLWVPKAETPEERRERLKQEAERKRQEKAARKKALRLLRKIVGRRPFHRFKRLGYLLVVGPTGTHYKLRPGRMIDVCADDGKVDHRLCIHAKARVPDIDEMITQYLLLTSGEEGMSILKSKAIKHPGGATEYWDATTVAA